MPTSPAAALLKLEREVFARRTPRSRERFERARAVFPGGDTRAATFYPPYPATIAETAGSRLIDVDGNEYVDLLFNYTSMIAGHAHPAVTEAVAAAFARTTPVAAPVVGQVELAEEIVRRVDSVEQLRFTNSGTEATMGATRIARATTGRDVVIKTIGGYHGSFPDLDYGLQPEAYPAGIPSASPIRLIHYNDSDALEAVLADSAGNCAALIIEPVMGTAGIIPPSDEFLQAARELTQAAGALLIVDEVITFRLARGGAQQRLGIEPDLTTLGKIIGGGLPVGAVGGPAELLAVLAPGAEKAVALSGTFNGNAATMAAGLATLELLDGEAYAKLDRLGERLADGLRVAVERTGVGGHVTHLGSLVNVHFTDEPPTDAGVSWSADADAAAAFHLGLMNRGFFVATRGLFAVSLVTTEDEIDRALAVAEELLAKLA
ncbi:MAG: aspartate aminotransferase family protein [Gaiellaceae bacterium]